MKFLTSRCGWIILNNALLNYENWILVIFLKFSFDALYWIICACVPQVEPVGSSYRAALHYGDHSGGDRGQRLTPHQPYHHTNHEGVTHCPRWLLILVLLSPIWFQSALPPCWFFFSAWKELGSFTSTLQWVFQHLYGYCLAVAHWVDREQMAEMRNSVYIACLHTHTHSKNLGHSSVLASCSAPNEWCALGVFIDYTVNTDNQANTNRVCVEGGIWLGFGGDKM